MKATAPPQQEKILHTLHKVQQKVSALLNKIVGDEVSTERKNSNVTTIAMYLPAGTSKK